MIIHAKRATVYAVAESTPGTAIADAALFLAANVFAQNQDITFETKPQLFRRQPDGPSLQSIASVAGQIPATMKFRHRAFTSGVAGTAPSYGLLLKACYASETVAGATSVTYAHSENQQTFLTLGIEWLSEDGTYTYRRVLKGARGNAKLMAAKIGDPFMWEETFSGAFVVTAGIASVTPVASFAYPNEVANGVRFTQFQSPSGIFLRQCDSFELDFGQSVEMATDTVDASGLLYGMLAGTDPTLKLGFRMVTSATHDDLDDFIKGALLGVSAVTFGTVAGKILTFTTGDSTQFAGLSYKAIGAAAGWEATIQLNRTATGSASNGWSLAFK